jgi:hypothetical protein
LKFNVLVAGFVPVGNSLKNPPPEDGNAARFPTTPEAPEGTPQLPVTCTTRGVKTAGGLDRVSSNRHGLTVNSFAPADGAVNLAIRSPAPSYRYLSKPPFNAVCRDNPS